MKTANRFGAFLVSGCLVFLLAAQPGLASEDHGRWEKHKPFERIRKELGLTDEQVAQIRPIMENMRKEMQALHERTRNEMAQYLTPEQLEKMDAMQEKRRERMKKRRFDD